jgi:hypothetical protein
MSVESKREKILIDYYKILSPYLFAKIVWNYNQVPPKRKGKIVHVSFFVGTIIENEKFVICRFTST